MSRHRVLALFSAAALVVPLLGAAPERELRARAYEFVGSEGECYPGSEAGHPIVQAEWLDGLGLRDAHGRARSGLLLSKNGPTSDCSAAVAHIRGAGRTSPETLGFDHRNGSHCGGGAPRFVVVTDTDDYYFLGCASGRHEPAPQDPRHWTRVRFRPEDFVPAGSVPPYQPGTTVIAGLWIVFDEGTDATSPGDNAGIGLAVIDNIAVGDRLITRGN